MPETDDERRAAILADPRIHASIRRVVFGRGVPEADAEDIVHAVLEAGCTDPKLPLHDPEEARLYLGACARHKAIDHARARKRRRGWLTLLDEETLASHAPPADELAAAHGVAAIGARKYPRSFDWLVRVAVGGESHADVARDANVAPARVRSQIASMRHALRVAAAGATAAAILLLVLTGLHFWIGRRPIEPIAHVPSAAPPAPSVNAATAPLLEAAQLRERARREVGRGDWDLAVADLNRAYALDPAGENLDIDVQQLRVRAQQKNQSSEAKPRR